MTQNSECTQTLLVRIMSLWFFCLTVSLTPSSQEMKRCHTGSKWQQTKFRIVERETGNLREHPETRDPQRGWDSKSKCEHCPDPWLTTKLHAERLLKSQSRVLKNTCMGEWHACCPLMHIFPTRCAPWVGKSRSPVGSRWNRTEVGLAEQLEI